MSLEELRVDDHVRLKPLVPEDAEALNAVILESQSELAAWLPWAAVHKGVADLLRYTATLDERRSRSEPETAFTILYDGFPVGALELHVTGGMHNLASVGYWLGTRYTGRGIMTKALVRFTEYVFETFPLGRLELYAVVDNLKSRGVAERAGYEFEGLLRNRLKLGDEYFDAALYARFPEKK